MKNYIKHIVEDFDFNVVNQSNSASDNVINTINLQNVTVDLGLPSGTLWCKYNFGCNFDLLNNPSAKTKPEDWYGNYYAWGENEPNKSLYDWSTYTYGHEYTLTKYTKKDNLTQLLPENDVVYQNLHIGNYKFHTPTKEQFDELKKYTNFEWVPEYRGINELEGLLLTSKINEKQIFIPATGGYSENCRKKPDFVGIFGHYWSSTISTWKFTHAFSASIDFESGLSTDDHNKRFVGESIRPVINL